MGLENREDRGNFISAFAGKFAQRISKEEYDRLLAEKCTNIVERINKNGKTVYEKHYDSFVAKLIGVKTQDSPIGKVWSFSFQDKGEVYHLQFGYSSPVASAFLKILPNIDLTQEMTLSMSMKKDEATGKDKTSLFVNQNKVALKHFYSKNNPNGLPQMRQIVVKGEQVWDSTDQLFFLENMVMTTIVPKLGGVATTATTATAPVVQSGIVADEEVLF